MRVTYKTLKWLQQMCITHSLENLFYLFNQGRIIKRRGRGN